MKIIITGCGKIGTALVADLVGEGHNITIIDNDSAVVEEMTTIYDVAGVCGNCADNDALCEAGVKNCELFIAATSSDETNMLACFIARKLGAQHTIARIRTPEYNDASLGFLCENLGISVPINPDKQAAREISKILKFPSAVTVESFSDKNFEMVELLVKADCPMRGMALSALRRQYNSKFLICAVQRSGEMIIPTGTFKLDAGDRIALTAAPNEVQKLLRQLGILQKQAKNVMILGASRTGFYLAKVLSSSGVSVKVIERDENRCREYSKELPDVVWIHGDGAQQEVLLEEGLTSMDAFVALTGSDEENILVSIYAQSQKVPKVIAKVNRPEMSSLAEKLGLDCVISPRNIMSNTLTRYARAIENSLGSNIATLHRIMDGQAEVVEFIVSDDFPHASRLLRDMRLRQNVLIAGIIRGRTSIIPSGDDMILPGDRVIVLASGHSNLGDLSDIVEQ